MRRNKFVKGVAILMLGSVLIGVLQAFALPAETLLSFCSVYAIDKIPLLI